MSRPLARLGVAALAAAAVAIVIAAATGSDSPDSAGPDFPLGFALPKDLAVQPASDSRARITESFRAVAPTAGKLRTSLRWLNVQPNCAAIAAGEYDWSSPDRVMRTVLRQGMDQLVTLNGPPPCAAVGGKIAFEPAPEFEDDFGAFAREVVERYGPRGEFFNEHPRLADACCPITDVEIWNEPNLSQNWRAHSADSYGRFFVEVAREIRQADNWGPKLSVVTGGVTGLNGGDWPTNGRDYIRHLYRVPGFKFAADKIGIHTYSPSPEQALENVEIVRGVMDKRNHDVPIEISEHGWSTCPIPGEEVSRGKCVAPEDQAELLEELVTGLRERNDELGVSGFLWFTAQDSATAASVADCAASPKFFYGFFDHSGEPKPAWTTWQSLTGATGPESIGQRWEQRECREKIAVSAE